MQIFFSAVVHGILLVPTNNCKHAPILNMMKDKIYGLMLKVAVGDISKDGSNLSFCHRLSV